MIWTHKSRLADFLECFLTPSEKQREVCVCVCVCVSVWIPFELRNMMCVCVCVCVCVTHCNRQDEDFSLHSVYLSQSPLSTTSLLCTFLFISGERRVAK